MGCSVLQLEKIQEKIRRKLGLVDDLWARKGLEGYEHLRDFKQEEVCLYWMMCGSELILTQMGVPVPNPKRMSKVLFTTRFVEVCGHKEAHEMFRMECLRHEEAWKLFQMKVGKEKIDDHSDIPKLVEIVTKECGGLPLALFTTARAMAYKKTVEPCNSSLAEIDL